MNASWAQSMFGMGFINLSGTCATTKLIQCRGMGLFQCDVARKFKKDPSEAPDLQRDDFMERKSVVDQMQRWCDEQRGKPSVAGIFRNQWSPILYDWEVGLSGVALYNVLNIDPFLQVAKSSAKKLVRALTFRPASSSLRRVLSKLTVYLARQGKSHLYGRDLDSLLECDVLRT